MNDNHKQPPPPLRVLVVEDNPFDVVMAQTILARCGFPCLVQHVARLTDGVAAAAKGADVVLLDLGLPDTDRADALAAVGRFGARVVVLSGEESPRKFYAAAKAGAAACVSKFAAHTQLLPTVLFVAGLCAASGDIPASLAEAIEGAI